MSGSGTTLELSSRFTEVGSSDYAMAAAGTMLYFTPLYHPYICDFLKQIRRNGVFGLLDPEPGSTASDLVGQAIEAPNYFTIKYSPNGEVVGESYPIEEVEFDYTSALGVYNRCR